MIMIGTNNTGHRQGKPSETAAGIKVILDEFRERHPNQRQILGSEW